MEFNRRLKSFLELKKTLERLSAERIAPVMREATIRNPWFTEANIRHALAGVIYLLREDQLRTWTGRYSFQENKMPRRVGIIMAGNIPLVGFHDLMCVLLSGHTALVKPSSHDEALPRFMAKMLTEIDTEWQDRILFVDKLNEVEAVIATGSDNSSRYFDYYFRKHPKIIRKNRTSVAIIDGNEREEELEALGEDIYRYFGLGCRNVSKIYIPESYDIRKLLDRLNHWAHLADCHKFVNNYNYSRAIYAMERIPYLDNGFSLFTESPQLTSPTAVVYYEKYQDLQQLRQALQPVSDKIQCIVSRMGWFEGSVEPGKAQMPEVHDYADGVDTMAFLQQL